MNNILAFMLPIGKYVEIVIEWMTKNLSGFFKGLRSLLLGFIDSFELLYEIIPFFVLILLFAAVTYFISSKKAAIITVFGLLIIYFTGLWPDTMKTFALVTASTIIVLVIGIPLGILAAKNRRADKIITPILNFMQTMPAFVYLIPAVYFFGLGTVPGAVATIIFAMPPMIKLTSLGLKQVPSEVVEAAQAFGATNKQLLFKVQVPLAMPTILAGLNQTIMLSLSMVVISAMISSGGLGEVVLMGIGQMNIGLGFEGGLAVVILALVLDNITQSLGESKKNKRRNK